MSIRITSYVVSPVLVEYIDYAYVHTGKAGTNLATGAAIRELTASAKARIWMSVDGALNWEDK